MQVRLCIPSILSPHPLQSKIFQWFPVAFTIQPQILNSIYMVLQAVLLPTSSASQPRLAIFHPYSLALDAPTSSQCFLCFKKTKFSQVNLNI